jgi:N utilization substance protein B
VTSAQPRRRAREAVFQALYQAEICEDTLAATWAGVPQRAQLPSDAQSYADELIRILSERLTEVDAALRPQLENWRLERLGTTDRGALRLGAAELLFVDGTPARVVLDEAVELASRFGGDASGAFVNGVLDRLARRTRPGDFQPSTVGGEDA